MPGDPSWEHRRLRRVSESDRPRAGGLALVMPGASAALANPVAPATVQLLRSASLAAEKAPRTDRPPPGEAGPMTRTMEPDN
jgi:hypothetical protein